MKSLLVLVVTSIIICLLVGACGSVAVELPVPTATATNTPRPEPVLVTPTPPDTPQPSPTPLVPTSTPTLNPRTPTVTPTRTVAPTRTPTPNLRSTPTSTPQPRATAIDIAMPNITPTPRPARSIGGDLLTITLADPSSLHLYGALDSPAQEYRRLLWDAKLLRRNPRTIEWQPHAAAAFKYDDKTRTVIVILKNNIYWSDGVPVTADDFVWTYQQISDPGKNWAGWGFYAGKIESYLSPEPGKLAIKLKGQFSNPLEYANVVEPLPKHIWGDKSWAIVEQNPEINKPNVISGAWKLKQWERGKFISFERNEKSSIMPVPYINSITYQIGSPNQALTMLERGEIDFLLPAAEDFQRVREMAKVIAYRWDSATPYWQYLGFNFRRQLWQDLTLRRAVAQIIERRQVISFDSGLGAPLYSDVPPGHPAFSQEVEKLAYNPALAIDELVKGGYSLINGRLRDKYDKEVSEVILLYGTEEIYWEKQAEYLQKQLGQIGLRVKLVPLEYRTYLETLKKEDANYDLFLQTWKHASPSLELFGKMWNNNYGGYVNRDLVNLYQQAGLDYLMESDPKTRDGYFQQIQQNQAGNLPYIYLYARQEYITVSARIGGVTVSPLGVFANRYTDWYYNK
jgi:peptide/nickel transport system substrate-binding protein